MTQAKRMVVRTLLTDPTRQWYGYDLTKRTGLPSATLSPLLMTLQRKGLLSSTWEDSEVEGRPRRRLYRIEAGRLADVEALLTRPASTPLHRQETP
jgi:DNA-binding PadR family transcriptional regulator